MWAVKMTGILTLVLIKKYQCGDELYIDNDLDRGHLVRRRDPVWGNSAEEANKDTFYFTNASPQHKKIKSRDMVGS